MDDNLIWSVYDRTTYYNTCKDLDQCPHKFNNKCFCSNYLTVTPTRIASCGFLCGQKPSIKKKCYIGFGEICSICLDPIISKRNAQLTSCGHQFHRKCIVENHVYRQMHRMTLEYSNEIPCPVCRSGLVECCVGLEDMDRYHSENGLDKLENFWLSMWIAPYLMCWTCNEGLGMNMGCKTCETYRTTGYL
jgi:Ring finger domain